MCYLFIHSLVLVRVWVVALTFDWHRFYVLFFRVACLFKAVLAQGTRDTSGSQEEIGERYFRQYGRRYVQCRVGG